VQKNVSVKDTRAYLRVSIYMTARSCTTF